MQDGLFGTPQRGSGFLETDPAGRRLGNEPLLELVGDPENSHPQAKLTVDIADR